MDTNQPNQAPPPITPNTQPTNPSPTTQTPYPPTPKKKNPWLLISFIVLLLGATSTFAYKYNKVKQQLDKKGEKPFQTQIAQSPNPETIDLTNPQSSPTQKPYIEDTNISGQKKYVNPELGISFLYLEYDYDGKNKISTKQISNKIYVYADAYTYDSGQYLEMFQKNPNISLEETLKKTFLENYSTIDCTVVTETTPSSYPTSYIQANIKVPGEFTDLEDMSIKWQKCPKTYVQTNGMSFFLMDQNYSDKFAFFSIGQYGIATNKDDTLWQDTVEFLD
jgi:hypothetical protein